MIPQLGRSPGEGIGYPLRYSWASLVAQMVKKPPAMQEVGSQILPGLGRSPGGGHGSPLQYFCLENPHGQRSLRGYSPRSRKESDTPEVTEHARKFVYFSNKRKKAFFGWNLVSLAI